MLANIFRSEHILIDNLRAETFFERIRYFSDQKVINYDRSTKELLNVLDKRTMPVLNLLSEMC